MLNRDIFFKDPREQRLANQGVAKLQAPTPQSGLETLRAELENFVCDGHYAEGLARILEAFLADVGKGTSPAAWISGFYGSGKSHLAAMLAALWENVEFKDGARADGLVQDVPAPVKAALAELRAAGRRHGGLLAAGGSMPGESADPGLVVMGFVFRAVGLPEKFQSARIAFWLADEGILEAVKTTLGAEFDDALAVATLSTKFAEAVLAAKPSIAADAKELRAEIKATFGDRAAISTEDVEKYVRKALTLGRDSVPLTLIVLDEVQQFLAADPGQTLKIQGIVERLSSAFEGRVLVVATGQQALSDLDNLQKLLGRFRVTVALADTDIDTVIRRTILRKDAKREPDVRAMLEKHSGEISRQLHGSPFAHSMNDAEDAVADWPLLPSRRRVWKTILAELDRSGLTGNLRGQLHTTLAAAQKFADRPLGHAVVTDFLYERVGDDAFNLQMITRETRERIEELRNGTGDDLLKARILMLVYMLSRIAPDADRHGVRARTETLADLMIEDLAGEPGLRAKVPTLLIDLAEVGAVVEVEGGEWRLQTKESAQWEIAFRDERLRFRSDPAAVSGLRVAGLSEALDAALAGVGSVMQGASKTPRRIHRLASDQEAPKDGVPLRIHNGYTEDLAAIEERIKAASIDDPTLYLLIPRVDQDAVRLALETRLAAEAVLAARGVGGTEDAGEARASMEVRRKQAESTVKSILKSAVAQAKVLQTGGAIVAGSPGDAVKAAALLSANRRYQEFDAADHNGWGAVLTQATRKQPDALKAVNHDGPAETHPVAKAILAQTGGAGKLGKELSAQFDAPPYGWPQDAVEAMLIVLANAGHLKARGEEGNPADPAELARQKRSSVRFQTESTVATLPQKLAVRALLQKANIPFETNGEISALTSLIEAFANAVMAAGGEAPAPAAVGDPDLATVKALAGVERLVALAEAKDQWLAKFDGWKAMAQKMDRRMPAWLLAERLVAKGAAAQSEALEAIRSNRLLLADPDPVAPLVQAAADALRGELNAAWDAWKAAWDSGEARLRDNNLWQRLSPEQKRDLRAKAGLRLAEQPAVDTPEAIAASLGKRPLPSWDSEAKALATRVTEALAEAAALLEPKSKAVKLAGGLIKTDAELETWLKSTRERLAAGLAEGPVIPEI